jgi:rhodanese-related sulfurtransferase
MCNITIIAFISLFFISCSPAEILEPEEVLTLLSDNDKKPVIIDLREVSSFTIGHIAGAENIPFDRANFQKRATGYDKKSPILIYCGKGLKTEEAAELLKNSGFKDIYILQGGFESWKNKGFEISK